MAEKRPSTLKDWMLSVRRLVHTGVGALAIRVIFRPAERIRVPRRDRYVVVTIRGLEFLERWFHASRIPSRLAGIYQLLLRLTWSGGKLKAVLAIKLWRSEVLTEALKNGYVRLVRKTDGLPLEVQKKISNIIGQSRGDYYV